LRGDLVDCVVLDIGLPDRNGFELCREVRAWSSVPIIIFVTARSDEVDRVVGLEIGGDDYVVKPFSPRELAARVKAVLRRSAAAGSAVAPAAVLRPSEPTTAPSRAVEASAPPPPFAVDPQRMAVSYFGTRLELSRYEYRILEVFIRRPGWVFSRERLMELVWEEPDASFDRTVDSHIKMLRAKLRAVRHDIDPIRTHRGLGYSLRESW
jgi:two-component system catabolic regulation response regulator CreB